MGKLTNYPFEMDRLLSEELSPLLNGMNVENFLIKNDPQKVEEACFELYLWSRGSESPSFKHMLFNLIAKADLFNMKRLSISFPFEVLAFKLWQSSNDEITFFEEFAGINRGI